MNDLQIHIAMGSDVGKVRRTNQDFALNADGLYLVCDGMGGGVGGEQASSITAASLKTLESLPVRSRGDIENALDLAQHKVETLGNNLGGISGTTVTGLVLPCPATSTQINDSRPWYVVNVGDSRTYHLDFNERGLTKANSMLRITKDHSQRQEAIDSGIMTPEVANATIPRNVITQAVGAPGGIHPDYFAVDPSGRFIICSDGLYSEVDDTQIGMISQEHSTAQATVDALVSAALEAGGRDNVTVIVVDAVMSTPDPQARWSARKLNDNEDLDSIAETS